MFTYFLKRFLRQKTMYIAMFIGIIISTCYIIQDVLPFVDHSLHHTPYTKWIESSNVSSFASLLFMLMPVLAAMACSHIYRQDLNQNYFSMIVTRGKKKQYFLNLYFFNFVLGGVTFSLALVWNAYCCFMLLPNEKLDFELDITNNVTMFAHDTLFPQMYFAHPFLHMLLYIVFGFFMAGIFATLALTASFYLKQQFFVWLFPFVYTYVYESILYLFIDNGTNMYAPSKFCVQVGSGIQVTGVFIFVLLTLGGSTLLYLWRVKKNEVL